MVTLSVALMAHPAREALVPELLEALACPGATIRVVWDERNSLWDTGRRAMLAYDPACSHHMVIQDDVLPCRDLIAALPTILSHVAMESPLAGYVGFVRPRSDVVGPACARADAKGACFLSCDTLNTGTMVVVPTAAIDAMVAYGDTVDPRIRSYDQRMNRYWRSRGMWTWYTWPCLVDHRDGPSLAKPSSAVRPPVPVHPHRRRIARNFIGTENSALDIDWTGPVVHAGWQTPFQGPCVTYRHKHAGRLLTVPMGGHRAQTLERNLRWELVT